MSVDVFSAKQIEGQVRLDPAAHRDRDRRHAQRVLQAGRRHGAAGLRGAGAAAKPADRGRPARGLPDRVPGRQPPRQRPPGPRMAQAHAALRRGQLGRPGDRRSRSAAGRRLRDQAALFRLLQHRPRPHAQGPRDRRRSWCAASSPTSACARPCTMPSSSATRWSCPRTAWPPPARASRPPRSTTSRPISAPSAAARGGGGAAARAPRSHNRELAA